MFVYFFFKKRLRMFDNSTGDQGSILGWVIPKIQKLVLDTPLLYTQHYLVCIKGKWSNPRKEVVPSPTPWCSSYWKGSLWVAPNYGWLTYFIYKLCTRKIQCSCKFLQISSFLSFLLMCLVLVYHGYTNANIGPGWVGTWLYIFLSSKCSNKLLIC